MQTLERCNKCGIGLLTHPEAYIFTCSYKRCNYSFRIDPVERPNPIKIIHKSDYIRGKNYAKN